MSGKTLLRNDLLCVERDAAPLTHTFPRPRCPNSETKGVHQSISNAGIISVAAATPRGRYETGHVVAHWPTTTSMLHRQAGLLHLDEIISSASMSEQIRTVAAVDLRDDWRCTNRSIFMHLFPLKYSIQPVVSLSHHTTEHEFKSQNLQIASELRRAGGLA